MVAPARRRVRCALWVVALVLLAACGSARGPSAPGGPASPELGPPASVEELVALGDRVVPKHPQYGYYVECVNQAENGAVPASGANDYSACPITPRLRAEMEQAPAWASPKALWQSHFCPCQQNPSNDRRISAAPAPGGGTVEILLYGGHVKVQLLAVRWDGRLLVDEVAAKGDSDSGSASFQEKPSPTPAPAARPVTAAPRATTLNGAGPAGSRTLDVPWYKQAYPLSCEAAALRMALAFRGVATTDSAILQLIGADPRAPSFQGDGSMRWGDPYETFVGSPNGSEVALTGYGTYYPTIASAARALGGTVLRAGEGIPAADVYQAVLDGHPVVAWVTYHWVTGTRRDYTSFGGRSIPYAGPIEHAVTVVGVTADSVYINNPWNGREWVSKATFVAAYGTYNRMAVVLA